VHSRALRSSANAASQPWSNGHLSVDVAPEGFYLRLRILLPAACRPGAGFVRVGSDRRRHARVTGKPSRTATPEAVRWHALRVRSSTPPGQAHASKAIASSPVSGSSPTQMSGGPAVMTIISTPNRNHGDVFSQAISRAAAGLLVGTHNILPESEWDALPNVFSLGGPQLVSVMPKVVNRIAEEVLQVHGRRKERVPTGRVLHNVNAVSAEREHPDRSW
jgi:hypothetical protein